MNMQAKSMTLLLSSVTGTVTIRRLLPHAPWLEGPVPEAARSLKLFRLMPVIASQPSAPLTVPLGAQAPLLARLLTKFAAVWCAAGSVP